MENGYVESFNERLRDELLAREVFDALLDAKGLIDCWRRAYNPNRPHSSLTYSSQPLGGFARPQMAVIVSLNRMSVGGRARESREMRLRLRAGS